MTGSYTAETTLGEKVEIVEKRGPGAEGVQVLIAEDGTEYVKDADNFGLLTPLDTSTEEDGVADDGDKEPDDTIVKVDFEDGLLDGPDEPTGDTDPDPATIEGENPDPTDADDVAAGAQIEGEDTPETDD